MAPDRIGLAVWMTVVVLAGRAAGADEALGKKVYGDRCAACHGESGGGDGPGAAALDPKPRNFRDADFWRGRTAAQMKLVVKDGKPGTLMAPFGGVLSDAEIDAVVSYLRTFKPATP